MSFLSLTLPLLLFLSLLLLLIQPNPSLASLTTTKSPSFTQRRRLIPNSVNNNNNNEAFNNIYAWGLLSEFSTLPLQYNSPNNMLSINNSKKQQLDNGHGFWKQVSSSHNHTLLLSHDGRVHVLGSNSHGQLGVNMTLYPHLSLSTTTTTTTTSTTTNDNGDDNDNDDSDNLNNKMGPMVIESLTKWNIVQVQAGQSHSMALASDGTLFMFGSNEWGQLGLNSKDVLLMDQPVIVDAKLLYRDNANDSIVVQIAAGDCHSLVLTRSNKLLSWGCNQYEQVGNINGGLYASVFKPQVVNTYPITSQNYVIGSIGATRANSYCSTTTGEMFVWGDGSKSQLGMGKVYNPISYPTPQRVGNYLDPKEQKAMGFYGGGDTFMAVTKFNETTINLISWGANMYCNEKYADDVIPYPRVIATLSTEEYFKKISISSSHALFLSNKNELFVCGNNTYGQLGTGNLVASRKLTKVAVPSDAFRYLDIETTDSSSLAILDYHCDNVHNCFNDRGVCVSQNKCQCNKGYSGIECQLQVCQGINSNDKNVCSGNGMCEGPDTCKCNPEFYGNACQTAYVCHKRKANDPHVCSGNGLCTANEVCKCYTTYYGKNCESSLISDGIRKRAVLIVVSLISVVLILVVIIAGVVFIKRTSTQHKYVPAVSVNDESSEDSDTNSFLEDSQKSSNIAKKTKKRKIK